MRGAQFYPGDKVIILGNDEGIEPGKTGLVMSKWRDTLYAIRTSDGDFHWLDSTEVSSIDPDRHEIERGDIIQITSSKHNHPFATIGDMFRVAKVFEDVDYYKVLVDNELHYLSNFELASYRFAP